MRDYCCKKGSDVSPTKEIVYPTKEEVVKTYSEETVKHIHPVHTTVVNCHTIKNEHLYPHTTSYENVVNEVDDGSGNSVAGVTDDYGQGYGRPSCHSGYKGGRKQCGRRRRRPWF